MEVVGLIGIIAALLVFIFLVYKGCVQYWAVMVSVAIVVLTNGMGFIDTLNENYSQAFCPRHDVSKLRFYGSAGSATGT